MSETTGAWSQNRPDEAYAIISKIIDQGTAEMKAQALLIEGMIKESHGYHLKARTAWLEALRYCNGRSFLKYSLEHSLATSFAKEDDIDQAKKWTGLAIVTCSQGAGFSGNKALMDYLTLNGGIIPEDHQEIVAAAVKNSWIAYEMAGVPDNNDLPKAILKLDSHFQDKVREIAG